MRIWILSMLALIVVSAGCSKNAEELSSPSHMFENLRTCWAGAKETLQTSEPKLGQVAGVENILAGPMRRTIEMDYSKPNKAELLKKYDDLGAAFQQNVSPMLGRTGYAVVLNYGYTNEMVRDAFMKLDADFEAMVKLAN
jgi:hypothetical protein